MLPVVHVESKFLFVGIHLGVDVYAIIRFEPIRCLPSGTGIMLMDFVAIVLEDENCTSRSIRCANAK